MEKQTLGSYFNHKVYNNNDYIFLVKEDVIEEINYSSTYDQFGELVGEEVAGDYYGEDLVLHEKKVRAVNLFDGQNWASLIFDTDYPGGLSEVDGETSSEILAAWEDAERGDFGAYFGGGYRFDPQAEGVIKVSDFDDE